MSDIVWEDPPARKYKGKGPQRAKRDWSAVVDVLEGRPGRWARVESGGRYAARWSPTAALLQDYGCETAQRVHDRLGHALYACWPKDAS